jgi:hypothetical protein
LATANQRASQNRAVFLSGRVMVRAIAILLCASALTPVLANAQSAMTPEQRMQSRFPQPVRVGDLIGDPVLDDQARTLGHIRAVIRTGDGKIKLIVDYGGLFGISWGSHPVSVPLEVVGIAGRHVSSLDMSDAEFASAPTWHDAGVQPVPDDTIIRIALARH